MFPIPWNKTFRKKDGTLVNIADAMNGGGGGSDLPPHSSTDAGKVLTVGEDGTLEWDTSGSGGGDSFLSYDFTKWGSRDIYDVLFSESGAVVKTRNGRIRIYEGLTNFNNFTLYLDTGDLHIDSTYGNHQRFLMGNNTNGFIYEKTNHVWAIYNGNAWEYSEISDADYFDNCTIKLYVDTNNVWHIYKNGTLVFEGIAALSTNPLMIGSSEYSIKDAVFYGARLYNGNYTE